MLALGLTLAETDALGLTLAEIEADGLREADGDTPAAGLTLQRISK